MVIPEKHDAVQNSNQVTFKLKYFMGGRRIKSPRQQICCGYIKNGQVIWYFYSLNAKRVPETFLSLSYVFEAFNIILVLFCRSFSLFRKNKQFLRYLNIQHLDILIFSLFSHLVFFSFSFLCEALRKILKIGIMLQLWS